MRTVCIMLLLLVGLQGCGRKGPLYLPPAKAHLADISLSYDPVLSHHE